MPVSWPANQIIVICEPLYDPLFICLVFVSRLSSIVATVGGSDYAIPVRLTGDQGFPIKTI